MTLPVTLSLIGVFLAIAVFAGWRGAQPPNPLRGVRMAPYRLIMVTAAAAVLFLLVHVVNLLGVTTGR
jgi:hypothetical protein